MQTDQPTPAAPTPPPEKPFTIKEAAEFLDLTVPTIYSKVSKGELPVSKIGGRLYFFRSDLMAYLKSGRKKSNAEIDAEAESYLNEGRAAK